VRFVRAIAAEVREMPDGALFFSNFRFCAPREQPRSCIHVFNNHDIILTLMITIIIIMVLITITTSRSTLDADVRLS
jgi:hypothetical protein